MRFPMRPFVLLVCFVVLCKAGAYFYWLAIGIWSPVQFDYGEGIVLWQAQHVRVLASAYSPIAQYPYFVFHYPPLYHMCSWILSGWTGDLLVAGRLLSFLSTLGICFILAWVVYRSVPQCAGRLARVGGAIFAGALPCGLDSMKWGRVMRVDMLALLLTFSALALFTLGRAALPRYAAFVLFVAAVYTRQTLITAPLACLLVAALMNLRQAAKLFAMAVALGTLVMVFLVHATHGEFIRHVFLYNQNPFTVRRMLEQELRTVVLTLPLLAFALPRSMRLLTEMARSIRRGGIHQLSAQLSTTTYRRTLAVLSIYFVLSGMMSLTIGKEGSNINYFLEWNLSLCALAGMTMARFIVAERSRSISSAYFLPLLIIVMPTATTVSSFASVLHTRSYCEEQAADLQTSDVLVRILQASPEPVMSENMTPLYLAGKHVPFEPAIVTSLAKKGMWDEKPLVNMIQRKTFSVMIIKDLADPVRYTPAVVSAIQRNYSISEVHGDWHVYRPRPTDPWGKAHG